MSRLPLSRHCEKTPDPLNSPRQHGDRLFQMDRNVKGKNATSVALVLFYLINLTSARNKEFAPLA